MAQNEKIIISVVLQDKNVSKKTKEAATSIKKLSVEQKALAKATKEANFWTTEQGVALAKAKISATIAKKETFELAKAQVELTKKTKQGKTQTGLNNAILTEAGRAASDAAYGMQGMANNLGQLLTLMSQHVETKGGFVASMKSLGKSLMGSGGVLILLQLLISYLPQIEAWFKGISNSVGFLSKSFKEAANSVKSTVGAFELYTETLKDSNKSQEQHKRATEGLKNEFPDYIRLLNESGASLDDVAKNTDKARIAEELYLKVLMKRAMANAAKEKIEEESAAKLQENIKAFTKFREMGFDVNSVEEFREEWSIIEEQGMPSMKMYESLRKKGLSLDEDRLDKAKELVKNLDKELKKRDENIKILAKFANIESNTDGGGGGERVVRTFKQRLLDLSQQLLKFQNDLRKTSFRTQQQIIKENGEASEAVITAKKDQFIETQKSRFKEFEAEQELRKNQEGANKQLINKAIEDARNKKDESIRLANEEATGVISAIKKVTKARLDNQKAIEEFRATKRGASVQEAVSSTDVSALTGMERVEAEKDLDQMRYENKVYAANLELALETTTEDKRRDIKSKMLIWEQEKRREDLENEIDAIEERKRVQMEYVGFAEQSASILNNLSQRNDKLSKAAMVAEKTVAIAKVLVNAQASIAARTAQDSMIPVIMPSPTGGIPNPMKPVSTKGMIKDNTKTKISAALAIANILTGGRSMKGGGGAGGDSGAGGAQQVVQPPDFNIIGSTGVNQLAGAIGTTTKEPVKAYVVSSEVSTAQELDRNIVESASI